MLPYTVIKEANPPQFSGTATGVVNFLNFTFSALLGPVFAWHAAARSAAARRTMEIGHYQAAFKPLLVRRRPRNHSDALPQGNRPGGSPRGRPNDEGDHDSINRNRKVRIAAASDARASTPVPTAVAHPCEESALAGAIEAGAKGLIAPILVGPAAKIREIAQKPGIALGDDRRSSTRRTATRPRPKPSSSCARARPSC